MPVAYVLFDGATSFFRERLPAGLRDRSSWALLMAGGAAALGAWFLLMIVKLMGGIPGWLGSLAGLLALGGLVAFGIGCWAYRRSVAQPEEAAG